MPQDLLPRAFQADCDRFYRRVVRATLIELPQHTDIRCGEFTSQDEFLDSCEKNTSNLIAYEARRSFALALSALFERQLQLWAGVHIAEEERAKILGCGFRNLLTAAARLLAIDLAAASLGDAIHELYLLANVVRHSDGRSCNDLWKSDRRFWQHMTDAAAEDCKQRAILSEFIQITDDDFIFYIRAVTRFWGLADREANAIIDGPY